MFDNISEEAKLTYKVERENAQRIADALGVEVGFFESMSSSTRTYYHLKCVFKEKGSAKFKKELASYNWIKDQRYRNIGDDGLIEHFTFVMTKTIFIES
ncbi:hypothetical protein BLX06_29700 [Bacillus cereus]|uniref:Uncharacterized protein n=1 Tax=Bacillus cereus TaxID=1396 RepID=A0A9X6B3N5_BACCE|nr:hypothetical protein [Bacillus cereus]MDA2559866.1 hypothetical protein [Bacillus cereus]OOR71607.1 hypothetical protein BLX06_29700 [Bacillus cereus]